MQEVKRVDSCGDLKICAKPPDYDNDDKDVISPSVLFLKCLADETEKCPLKSDTITVRSSFQKSRITGRFQTDFGYALVCVWVIKVPRENFPSD